MLGLDILGLANKNWKIKATAAAWPDGWAMGFFDDPFGPAKKAFLELYQEIRNRGKEVPAVRVHLHWSTAHKIAPMDKVITGAMRWNKVAKRLPNVKFYVSHSCEHSERNQAEVKKRLDAIKRYAPHCIPVNCFWQGAHIRGVINEWHKTHEKYSGKYIVSCDGEAGGGGLPQMNANLYRRRHRGAEIRFLWAARFNLRVNDDGKPPCKQRKHAPDAEYIKGIVRLGTRMGKPPTPCFNGKVVQIRKPRLYKPYSEDKGTNDRRANKPLLIVPAKVAELKMVTKTGEKVGVMKYYAPDANTGMYRYYLGSGSGEWGWQLADVAQKKSGYPYVWATDGNTFYGPIQPAFRRGYFK